jgi:hypothetical protein
MIDFGLSFNTDNKANERNIFISKSLYTYWCIDTFYISHILFRILPENKKNKKIQDVDIISIINEYMNNDIFLISYFTEEDKRVFYNNQKNAYLSFVGKPWKSMLDRLWRKNDSYTSSWDHYSLVVMYLIILHNLNILNKDMEQDEEEAEIKRQFIDHLKSIVLSVPEKRIKDIGKKESKHKNKHKNNHKKSKNPRRRKTKKNPRKNSF